MSDWCRYIETQASAELGKWIDELIEQGMSAEDIASTVIEDGSEHVPNSLFDSIVEYVEKKRS